MAVVVQMDRTKEVLLLDSCMVIFSVFLKIPMSVTTCGVCFDL